MTDDKAQKIALMEAARRRIEEARSTVHAIQREHKDDIDAWAKAFLDFHPVAHQRTREAIFAWADQLPWPDERGGIEQARMGVRTAIAMKMAYADELHLTPLQKYRLENPPVIGDGASMDLSKQMEHEFRPFLSPDLQLDGTDIELADLRKKLIEIDRVIGRYHEVKFQLRQRGYEIAIRHPRSMSTVDEIKRDAIIAEIEMIMSGEQS